MHSCGILPKNCRVAPSPLRHVASLSFHPDGKFSFIPPGHLTSGFGRRSTFSGYLTSGSGQRSTLSGCLIAAILSGRHPTFSGYLTSGCGQRSTLSRSQPPFYPTDILLSPDVSQPQFYPVEVPPSPDIFLCGFFYLF